MFQRSIVERILISDQVLIQSEQKENKSKALFHLLNIERWYKKLTGGRKNFIIS
jgi:hypothetical protein